MNQLNERHQTIKNQYKKALQEYFSRQEHAKNEMQMFNKTQKLKADPLIIIKFEMNVKLSMIQLDSSRVKLEADRDNLIEINQEVFKFNRKIKDFTKKWEINRVSVIQTTIRLLVQAYENMINDHKILVKELLYYQNDHVLKKRQQVVPFDTNQIQSRSNNQSILYSDQETSFMAFEDYDDKFDKKYKNLFQSNDEFMRQLYQQEFKKSVLMEFNQIQILKYLNKKVDDYQIQHNQWCQKIQDILIFQQEVKSFLNNLVSNYQLYFKQIGAVFQKCSEFQDNQIILQETWEIIQKSFSDIYGQNLKENIEKLSILEIQQLNYYKTQQELFTKSQGESSQYLKKFGKNIREKIMDLEDQAIFAERRGQKPDQFYFVDQKFNQNCLLQIDQFQKEMKQFINIFEQLQNDSIQQTTLVKKNIMLMMLKQSYNNKRVIDDIAKKIDVQMKDFDQKIQFEEDQKQFQPENPLNLTDIMINLENNLMQEEKQKEQIETILVDQTNFCSAFITKYLRVMFQEWTVDEYFNTKMIKMLNKSLNYKRPATIGEMKVKILKFDDKAPEIREVNQNLSESFEVQFFQIKFLYDLNMSYRGKIFLEIETGYNIIFNKSITFVPITVKINIQSLNGKIRICFVPSSKGKSWYSFIGEPIIDIQMEPVLGRNMNFKITDIPKSQELIKDLIIQKIKKMTHPNRQKIDLPMTKEITINKNNYDQEKNDQEQQKI